MTATPSDPLPQTPAGTHLFETYEDFENAPPMNWVIEGLAQEQESTLIAGLSGQGKTWISLSIAKALLAGEKLFDTFAVPKRAQKVIYLIPEVGRCPFYKRLKTLNMDHFVRNGRLFVRTLSKGEPPALIDPQLLKAAEGADLFLDTIIRFIQGDENSSSDNRALAGGVFRLLKSARTVWGTHHSPKSFQQATEMTLENAVRGSGDIGAMVSNAYGIRQLVNESNLIHIECLKGRDLDEVVQPFQIEGRPWIDREGKFRMVKPPGECEDLAAELSRIDRSQGEKKEFAKALWQRGVGRNEIVRQVRENFKKCSDHTVSKWIGEWEKAK